MRSADTLVIHAHVEGNLPARFRVGFIADGKLEYAHDGELLLGEGMQWVRTELVGSEALTEGELTQRFFTAGAFGTSNEAFPHEKALPCKN